MARITIGERTRSRSKAGRRTSWKWSWIQSDRTKLLVFLSFALLVTFMGGGSRSDINSLLFLRPISILFCLYALMSMGREEFRRVRVPLFVLLALLGIAVFQVIPLPAFFAGRGDALDALSRSPALTGFAGSFQPISLDPNRTWNTIFALFVPIAAVCLYAIQSQHYRQVAALALVGAAGLSAIVAIGQVLGGDIFYLYRITNSGSAVGLFANRNHQSILLLWLMMSVCFYAGWSGHKQFSERARTGMAIAIVLALTPLLILTGSRAGLVLSAPTFAMCAWLLLRSRGSKGSRTLRIGSGLTSILLILGFFLVLAAIFGVLYFDDRSTAISRLFGRDAVGGRRLTLLPIYLRMAADFLPFGAGFGSFESVFKVYEPANELSIFYMNQAHNDLLQLAIEGGIPVLAVLLFGGGWLCWTVWSLWRSSRKGSRHAAIYLGGSIAVWLCASLVDYPLRTPFAAMVFAALTARLSFLSTPARLASGMPDQ